MVNDNNIADIAYDDNEDFLGPSPMQYLPNRAYEPETRDAAPSTDDVGNNNRRRANKSTILIRSPLDSDWAGNSSSLFYDPTSLVGASFARSAYDVQKMVNTNNDPSHTKELDITMRSLKELTTSCSKLLYKDLPNGVQSFVDTTRGKSNKLSLLQCSSHPEDVPEEEEAACMDTVMNCTATTINSMNSINDDDDDLNNNSSMIDNNNNKNRNNNYNNTKKEEGTEAIIGVDDDDDDDDDKNKYDDTITWTKKKHDYVENDDVDTNNNNTMMKTKEYSTSNTNNSSKSVSWTKKHGFIEEDVYTNTQMMKTKQYSNSNINNSITSDYCKMMSEHCEQKLASLNKEGTVVTPQKMKQRAKTVSGVLYKKINTTGNTSMSSLNQEEETVVTPKKMKPRAISPSKLLRKRFHTNTSLLSMNKNKNKKSTIEREKTPRRQRKKRLSITASPFLSWATTMTRKKK